MRDKVYKVNYKMQCVCSLILMHSNVFINMTHKKYLYEANWGLWESIFFKCSVNLNYIYGDTLLNRQITYFEMNVTLQDYHLLYCDVV